MKSILRYSALSTLLLMTNSQKANPLRGLWQNATQASARLWYRNICKKAKDFNDPIKWENTKAYFKHGGWNAQSEITRIIEDSSERIHKKYPEAFKRVVHFVAEQLNSDADIRNLLIKLLAFDADTVEIFIPKVLESLDKDNSRDVAHSILERHPAHMPLFFQAIVERFDSLHGNYLIAYVMENHAPAAETFAELAKQSLERSLAGDKIINFMLFNTIDEIFTFHPNSIDSFVPFARALFLHKSLLSQEQTFFVLFFFKTLIKGHPALADELCNLAIASPGMLKSANHIAILDCIIDSYPELAQKLAPSIISTCETIAEMSYTGTSFIKNILNHHSASLPAVAKRMAAYFEAFLQHPNENCSFMNLICGIIRLEPSTAKLFTPIVLKSFCVKLSDTLAWHISEILVEILAADNNPLLLQTFVRFILTTENVIREGAICYAIKKDLERPDSIALNCARDSFATATREKKTTSNRINFCLFCLELIKQRPNYAELFVKPYLQAFELLLNSHEGYLLLSRIIKYCPEQVETIAIKAAALVRHTQKESIYFSSIIQECLALNPALAKQLAPYVAQNFETYMECSTGCQIILTILNQDPESAKLFCHPATNSFASITQSDCELNSGTRLLRPFLNRLPISVLAACKPLITGINKCSDAIGRLYNHIVKPEPKWIVFYGGATQTKPKLQAKIFTKIVALNPMSEQTFFSLADICGYNTLAKHISLKKKIPSIIACMNIKKTQSSQHFNALQKHNSKKLANFLSIQSNGQDRIKKIIERIVSAEDREQAKGRYTFVHAYRWDIRFLQDLDAHLRPLVQQGKKHALSLRFSKAPKSANATAYVAIREKLLQMGIDNYDAQQKYALFMNYALFCNQYGSNTLQYFINNRCERANDLRLLERIFSRLGLADARRKYKKEIKELEKLHQGASAYGAGLLLSFTPEALKQCVYACHPGGRKRTVTIDGIGETDDVQLIIDTLRTAPEKLGDQLDHLEFVFVLTKDYALNREIMDGDTYNIVPFNAADPDKLKLYELKRDELIAKIKRDLDAARGA